MPFVLEAARLPRNVLLVGYRGVGKTSVGRALAARLGWRFVDTDIRIEAIAHKTVRAIFMEDGEPAFRRLEHDVIVDLARERQQVVSLGGGAVLSEANRDLLRDAGRCIWLTASPEELFHRLSADPQTHALRPPLTGLTGLAEIEHLLREREPLYAAVAQHAVATSARTVDQVVESVLAALAEYAAPPDPA